MKPCFEAREVDLERVDDVSSAASERLASILHRTSLDKIHGLCSSLPSTTQDGHEDCITAALERPHCSTMDLPVMRMSNQCPPMPLILMEILTASFPDHQIPNLPPTQSTALPPLRPHPRLRRNLPSKGRPRPLLQRRLSSRLDRIPIHDHLQAQRARRRGTD